MHDLLSPRAPLALLSAFVAAAAAPAFGQVSSTSIGSNVRLLTAPVRFERLVGVAVGADAAAIANAVGATLEDRFGDGVTSLGLNGPGSVSRFTWPDAAGARTGIQALAQSADVVFVERNTRAGPYETSGCAAFGQVSAQQCTAAFFDGTPTLPEYSDQPALPAIDLFGLSPSVPGAVTLVAVIDTGVDPAHSALSGRLAGPGYDFVANAPGGFDVENGVDDDGDGLVDEAFGHGTHVAGTITLIDPDALVLPYRVLDADGNGTAFDVALAMRQAGADGAQFVNLSLGLAAPSEAVYAAIESLDDDCIVFASAGNTGLPVVGNPARRDDVIAVAAGDEFGVLASCSAHGRAIDLVAPGIEIYGPMPGERWARWSGSSMAVAVASGAASRLHSWRMTHDPDDTVEALIGTAFTVDPLNPGAAGLLGTGLIQLGAAGDELAD